MPGLQDGSDAANAFEWDFTASPNGEVVYGDNTVNGEDWWRVKLLYGEFYDFATILPQNFDTFLYLYDKDEILLDSDDDGGDGLLSYIGYQATYEGFFYLVVGGAGGATGAYSLESSPAPLDPHTKAFGTSKFSVLGEKISQTSKFQTQKYPKETFLASKFNDIFKKRLDILSKYATSSEQKSPILSKFNITKTERTHSAVSKFNINSVIKLHNVNIFNLAGNSNVSFASKIQSFIDRKTMVSSKFNIYATKTARGPKSTYYSLVKTGWYIYIEDIYTGNRTYLGFIDGDAVLKELTDIAVPDGEYNTVVIPADEFWRDNESRFVYPFEATAGGVVTLLPEIDDLQSEIVNTKTIISFTVKPQDMTGITLGLWFSPTPAIDISGAPDVTLQASSNYSYSYTKTQISAEYVAVASVSGATRGNKQELELAWVTTPPNSPRPQTAYRADN